MSTDTNTDSAITIQQIYKSYADNLKKDLVGYQRINENYEGLIENGFRDLVKAKYEIIANLTVAIESKLKLVRHYLKMFPKLEDIVSIYRENGFRNEEVRDFVACIRSFFFNDENEIFRELNCIDIRHDNTVGYHDRIVLTFSNGKVLFDLEISPDDMYDYDIFESGSFYNRHSDDYWTDPKFYDRMAKLNPVRAMLSYELPMLNDQIAKLYSKLYSIGMRACYHSSPHCIDSIATEANPMLFTKAIEEFLIKAKERRFDNTSFA